MTDEDSTELLQNPTYVSKDHVGDFIEHFDLEMQDIDESEESDYIENRNALRFTNRDIEVWVKVIGVFKTSRYEKFALRDISSLGATIQVNKKLKIGKKLAIKFVFGRQSKYFLQARIIRRENESGEYVYGIQFDKKNSFLGKKLVQTEFKTGDLHTEPITIRNTPDDFLDAINTFFSLKERLCIRKRISTK